ncbi:MAG: sigma-54-dependent Fis family transcriptional regulator [Spirochaetae bacterium HGW-Spirochaetae-3]|jgi:two-component system response regulator AtoC|nr:MAG: sigma-54-dependent Fis family transcriptional regulator [Spirochaetae bacterium HGW-Spirochaetae-3]
MRILVADDEPNLLSSIGTFLKAETIDAALSPDGAKAKALLSEESFDAAVLDIRMPGLDGISLLRWIKDEGLTLPVIMMSAHGDVRDAVEAMRLGAFDYLVKPFDPDELAIRLRKAVRDRRLSADREASRRPSGDHVRMIGDSSAVKDAVRLIERAAPTPSTILITGESGTGKEVAARLVHERSGRQGAFVAVNLGAVPENLLESELFGYEKGAFTGATDRKLGLFELADGGTLFLDEIGEMPAHMQVKILRVIQERKVSRLGGTKGVPVDARIVAATNRDLEKMVADGSFREDLYYRINVVRINLPPLRERPGDARELTVHFARDMAPRMGRHGITVSTQALDMIAAYPFPGNVRELMNAVERALILAEGDELSPADFQLGTGAPSLPGPRLGADLGNGSSSGAPFVDESGAPLKLAEIERRAILVALGRNGGKRESTAAEMGITRRTLLNKLKEYGYKD